MGLSCILLDYVLMNWGYWGGGGFYWVLFDKFYWYNDRLKLFVLLDVGVR